MTKHKRLRLLLFWTLLMIAGPQVNGQIPYVDIIKVAIKKVIKATDLMVQRLQNKTIALQNIQRQVENEMSRLKLDAIGGWVEKQRKLYKDYFEELRKVKSELTTYSQVRNMLQTGSRIAGDCGAALRRVRQDKHFTPEEIDYMKKVYGGILRETGKNLEGVGLVIQSYRVQMSDGERLSLIDAVGAAIEKNGADLRQFNQQNLQISLQRAAQEKELENIRNIYGL